MTKYRCPECGMEYDNPGKCTMDGAVLVKMEDNNDHSHQAQEHSDHQKHDHSQHHRHMADDSARTQSFVHLKPVLIFSLPKLKRHILI